MSAATGAEETEAFARLLRELKDRSGLSYGALAKRLHMSTSTLHRYCNGTAVPIDYAPVERLARVCRATPQDLVELHRRWILADAARRRRADQVAPTGSAQGAASSAGSADATDSADAAHAAETVETVDPGSTASHGQGEGENGEPVVVDAPRDLAPPRRPHSRRTVLIASVAVAAVLGAVVLAVNLPSGGAGGRRAAGDTAVITGTVDAGKPSAAPSPSAKGHKPSASASASPTESEGAGSGTSKGGGKQGAAQSTGDGATDAVPLTVGTRPYVYDDPCSQHFLVDSEPEQVGPPASEQDAPRWAAAYGAVSSGEQRIALTVQGTGEETVVLEALHVRVLTKGAPLAWNDYSMGVGCGGGVGTKSFDIGLDNGSPTVTVKNGQRDFPYKVSESDPEVFYVNAHTEAHDVRWDLTLDWSSGSRRGTVHIDDNGTPFRTSADADRPGYDYPLGGGEWIKRES
ncbi:MULTISPECIES: helix-turn-helix transcriptional regulator [unclassified Streptomyces]|uniref:helix-turn-helix domain-containing protein n=1 Tax=unclassified Streptomyces TaxID=2593676 RepID=UPI002E803AC9|nr:helix-turn-helix transcriptional regulator [Streptomyces sp. NBC_00589]WTI37713.1 helix-turn-helix domain-containing protein [Streptomyces sp. NBC_00775]WUB28608.1 helix-turn-helix domain-containing protein [Streptomyces sp. NBC_00589]